MEAIAIDPTIRTNTSAELEIEVLYVQVFPNFAAHVARHGGSLNDARDKFHDALIDYMEYCKNGKPVMNKPAYIMTIAKNLWTRQVKLNKRNLSSENELINRIPLAEESEDGMKLKLYNYLVLTGRKCLDLLSSFYFEEKKIQDIAHQYGFSDSHSASVQKYKCVEKLRNVIKQKSLNYDDFG